MIDKGILNIIAGVSTFLGFISVIAYFYFKLQIASAEKSISNLIVGESLFNAEQVLKILSQLESDESRISALKELTKYDAKKAQNLLEKVESEININVLSSTASNWQRTTKNTTIFFMSLAILALLWSFFNHTRIPDSDPDVGVAPVIFDASNKKYIIKVLYQNSQQEILAKLIMSRLSSSGFTVKLSLADFSTPFAQADKTTSGTVYIAVSKNSNINAVSVTNLVSNSLPIGRKGDLYFDKERWTLNSDVQIYLF